jgi:Rhodopirellula transposase DDE domain
LTNEDGGCLRQLRRGRRVAAAWRQCRGLRDWLARLNRGEDDLDAGLQPKGTVRRSGGGRRAVRDKDLGLIPAPKSLVEPATLGDPMRPLIWVSKSMDKLAAALTEMGHPISADTVDKELVELGFSRQFNRKTIRRLEKPRSKRPVRIYQRKSRASAATTTTGYLR